MKNIIWDLDGTLIDSYGIFMKALEKTYLAFGLDFYPEKTYHFIKKYSVNALFEQENIDFELLKTKFTEESVLLNDEIQLIEGAREVLDWAKSKGFSNFIYTHKNKNAHWLLEQLKLSDYFVEVVTSENHFPRKPDPAGILYLMKKYDLSKNSTYYIGDRSLDVEAALNSGIQSINFIKAENSIQMKQLTDIMKILE